MVAERKLGVFLFYYVNIWLGWAFEDDLRFNLKDMQALKTQELD